MGQRKPVADWTTDVDHLTDEWAAHGPEIFGDLRARCPVPSTQRFHGAVRGPHHVPRRIERDER